MNLLKRIVELEEMNRCLRNSDERRHANELRDLSEHLAEALLVAEEALGIINGAGYTGTTYKYDSLWLQMMDTAQQALAKIKKIKEKIKQ